MTPRRAIRTALGVACLAGVAAALAWSDVLWRADLLWHDTLARAVRRPIASDIVIVTIDEKSLRSLGRWPWPRRLHAALVDRLHELGARVIGFDVAFLEPSPDDERLAQAMARAGNVVLPVVPDRGPSETAVEGLPVPQLLEHAAGLGQVEVEPDGDGLVRGVYLHAGLGSARWPSLPLAMIEAVERRPLPDLPGGRPAGEGAAPWVWVRDHHVLVSFAGPPGTFRRLSYVDVLEGRVSADGVRGAHVFVGSIAPGIGDVVATPVSGRSAPMSGVEFMANVLQDLRDDGLRHDAGPVRSALASGLFAALVGLGFVLARRPLLLVLVAAVTSVGSSALLLVYGGVWLGPAATLLTLAAGGAGVLFQSRHAGAARLHDVGPTDARAAGNAAAIVESSRGGEPRREASLRDPLTSLPNRFLLRSRLERVIDAAGREGQQALVVLIDVGRFHAVNERVGIQGGDAILKVLAGRLRDAVRDADDVARVGGDEFAVVISGRMTDAEALSHATRLVDRATGPVDVAGVGVTVTANVGYAVFPSDGDQADSLLQHAATALAWSREAGLGRIQRWDRTMQSKTIDRIELEHDLRAGLERGEFGVAFQPQVALATGRLCGLEALARWRHPIHGQIAPATFIPAAEQLGLIDALSEHLLGEVCMTLRTWQTAGLAFPRVAINVSPYQLVDDRFAERLTGRVRAAEISPTKLSVEVTESVLLRNVDLAARALRALQTHGVTVALDDFGMGYSSLNVFRQLPIDEVKIDGSFVRNVVDDENDRTICVGVITMAHSANRRVTAEGVETFEQADLLRAEGCDAIQGYLVGRPLAAGAITPLLRTDAVLLGK